MKRFLFLMTICAFTLGLKAQVVDTTVCDILKDPVGFNGKTVRIKGTVVAGFDSFIVKDKSCASQMNALWLSYPEGAKGKAGPAAMVQLQPAKNFAGPYQAVTRTPVKLEKNQDFKQFDNLLSTPHKQARTCLGCNRYEVSATLVGRIDGVGNAKIFRDPTGKIVRIDGFGNLNAFPARIVLQSVADVVPREVDFSKADEVVKSQPPDPADSRDRALMNSVSSMSMSGVHASAANAPNASVDTVMAIDQLRSTMTALDPNSPLTLAIERATDVYGKHSEHGSVTIDYGIPNEVPVKLELQSTHETPSGVLFNCVFNATRLQGDAMSSATVHLGEHIADILTPQPNVPLPTVFDKEYQAWATTVLEIVATRQRTLVLDGGFVLWNEFWQQSERNKALDTAISDYLRKQEMLTR